MPDKGIVKVDIVRNENSFLQQVKNPGRDFLETRRTNQHFIGDSGKRRNISREGHSRVNQCLVTTFLLDPVVQDDGDFRDPVGSRMPAGGFDIYNRIHDANLWFGINKKGSSPAVGKQKKPFNAFLWVVLPGEVGHHHNGNIEGNNNQGKFCSFMFFQRVLQAHNQHFNR